MSDMHAAAHWLVHEMGYPLDIGCDVPPPQALRDVIVQVIVEDEDGTLHGNELDREGVLLWLADEDRGWRRIYERNLDLSMPNPSQDER